MLVALAQMHDRTFESMPEGELNHVNDWDSALPPGAFYLVAGTHTYQDGRRKTKHCTTFQAKRDALAFAQRWKLNCPADEIRVMVGSVEWRPFEPTAKADIAALRKIETLSDPEGSLL